MDKRTIPRSNWTKNSLQKIFHHVGERSPDEMKNGTGTWAKLLDLQGFTVWLGGCWWLLYYLCWVSSFLLKLRKCQDLNRILVWDTLLLVELGWFQTDSIPAGLVYHGDLPSKATCQKKIQRPEIISILIESAGGQVWIFCMLSATTEQYLQVWECRGVYIC